MKHIIFILLTVAVLSGCASQNSLSPAMQADLAIPIYCEGSGECKAMWKRALRFVSLNAGYPITTANAFLIEAEVTERNRQNWSKYDLGIKVTKSPLSNARYQIKVTTGCYAIFSSCSPDAEETLWRALLFIREGRE